MQRHLFDFSSSCVAKVAMDLKLFNWICVFIYDGKVGPNMARTVKAGFKLDHAYLGDGHFPRSKPKPVVRRKLIGGNPDSKDHESDQRSSSEDAHRSHFRE